MHKYDPATNQITITISLSQETTSLLQGMDRGASSIQIREEGACFYGDETPVGRSEEAIRPLLEVLASAGLVVQDTLAWFETWRVSSVGQDVCDKLASHSKDHLLGVLDQIVVKEAQARRVVADSISKSLTDLGMEVEYVTIRPIRSHYGRVLVCESKFLDDLGRSKKMLISDLETAFGLGAGYITDNPTEVTLNSKRKDNVWELRFMGPSLDIYDN